mmetsp:Transcript_11455/g.17364  ORF Transcript_11455/g.17364 Transcript_11455/m.17364 type:complete len:492 (+) Transcript_11455:49-1524(+)|eukprot:CAMPEP_0202698680 /NCGR_PEP_ID=MMETSP1385-20130828/11922_1 /ASSEMBLY_ACC=CAM_ASM_000861 /TAXON_ID=933848 /ORGANISM="Elphidium margaritaceum" /LENGTH=491 /DNA_ID=CAMNT_0049355445 /DNA_START=38 /DNA_END=1513 /DNA_ORIENTATION=-
MASPKSDNHQKTNNGDAPKFPTITRAELAGNYFNKHVAFVIKTTSGQEIKRRYTDFEWLRGLLRTLYPGAFIPPIPPKLPVAMWPQGYLLMRKRELQQFLQRLEVIPYLKRDEITVFFLSKHHSSFDKVRKQWEKDHPKPSDKWLHENLVKTFPKIHETETPSDMNKRCSESTQLIESSVRQLETMVKSCESFIERSNECCSVLTEFRNAFDDLVRTEYAGAAEVVPGRYFGGEKRVDISPHIEQWRTYKSEELSQVKLYYLPALHRALNDLRVIREILHQRDQIQSEYNAAKQAAEVWNDPHQLKQVRSSDLARKHREIQKEEDLRRLKAFVEKLVLGQLNVVFCANQRRWKKSCHLFAEKHVASLEKAIGSWKALTNKILHSQGNTEAMHKAVTVESIAIDEEKEEKNANANVDVNDVDVEEEVDVKLKKSQLQDVNIEQIVNVDDVDVVAEDEIERKERDAASKAKMNEMFKDEDETENAPNEFPWDE